MRSELIIKNEEANFNVIPIKRADYIAKTKGTRAFPWRVIAISGADKDLLNNDIVQKLASPPRLDEVSWIVPGQVAWDWWNDYNITHVDFRSGMNTLTFKYYIDFAAANKAKYTPATVAHAVQGNDIINEHSQSMIRAIDAPSGFIDMHVWLLPQRVDQARVGGAEQSGDIGFRHLLVEGKVMVFPVAIREVEDIHLDDIKTWMRWQNIELGNLANFDHVRLSPIFVRA